VLALSISVSSQGLPHSVRDKLSAHSLSLQRCGQQLSRCWKGIALQWNSRRNLLDEFQMACEGALGAPKQEYEAKRCEPATQIFYCGMHSMSMSGTACTCNLLALAKALKRIHARRQVLPTSKTIERLFASMRRARPSAEFRVSWITEACQSQGATHCSKNCPAGVEIRAIDHAGHLPSQHRARPGLRQG
jgi:hypothetical protein